MGLKYVPIIFAMFIYMSCSEGGEKLEVFKYNHTSPISTLDPAFAKSQNVMWACHHIFSTLFELDTTMQIRQNLTKFYDVDSTGLNYTFHLREDVYFHTDICFAPSKTRKLNSYDVKYSYERLLDKDVKSPGSWIFSNKLGEKGIEVVDSFTLTIQLSQPFPPLLGLLTSPYCSIIPREAVEYYGRDIRSNPVGTGPFKLKRWLEGEALYLVRNDNYFKDSIAIDGVVANYITDKKIAFLELLQGNLDYVSGLESAFSVRLLDANGNLKPEYTSTIDLHRSPFLNTEYIGIHPTSPESVLNERPFRQALNLAIDKQLMLKTLRNNIGKAAQAGIVHPGLAELMEKPPNGYTYNPQLAKSLLETIDYQGKYKAEVLTIHTNEDYLDLITFVGRQWEAIGVKVKIEVLESSLLRQGMRSGDLSLFRASWIADYPDPENFLCLFYGQNPAPPNYTRFSNTSFDSLFQRASKAQNPMKRAALYSKLDSIVVEEAPVVFLFYDETAVFTSKRFTGHEINALNMLEVENLTFSRN